MLHFVKKIEKSNLRINLLKRKIEDLKFENFVLNLEKEELISISK